MVFVKNFLAGVSKLHSTCPWKSFEKVFFGIINLIYLIGTLSETLFYFCWKIFGRDSHNYNLHVRRKMLMETSLFLQKIVFYHFWTFTEVHQPSVKFFRQGCENAVFVSTETFWREVFLWETYLSPLFSQIDWMFFNQLSIVFRLCC